MPVIKHLYALIHGSTYCTYRLLTVTLPVGECACAGQLHGGGRGHGGWLRYIYMEADTDQVFRRGDYNGFQ